LCGANKDAPIEAKRGREIDIIGQRSEGVTRIGIRLRADEDLNDIHNRDRHAEARNKREQRVRALVAQRSEGDTLNHDCDQPGQQRTAEQRQRERQTEW